MHGLPNANATLYLFHVPTPLGHLIGHHDLEVHSTQSDILGAKSPRDSCTGAWEVSIVPMLLLLQPLSASVPAVPPHSLSLLQASLKRRDRRVSALFDRMDATAALRRKSSLPKSSSAREHPSKQRALLFESKIRNLKLPVHYHCEWGCPCAWKAHLGAYPLLPFLLKPRELVHTNPLSWSVEALDKAEDAFGAYFRLSESKHASSSVQVFIATYTWDSQGVSRPCLVLWAKA